MQHPIKAIIAVCVLAFLVGNVNLVAFSATGDTAFATRTTTSDSKKAYDGTIHLYNGTDLHEKHSGKNNKVC